MTSTPAGGGQGEASPGLGGEWRVLFLKKITRLKFELSTLIFMLIFLLNKQLKK